MASCSAAPRTTLRTSRLAYQCERLREILLVMAKGPTKDAPQTVSSPDSLLPKGVLVEEDPTIPGDFVLAPSSCLCARYRVMAFKVSPQFSTFSWKQRKLEGPK
ncbi:hypothetical protein KM043_002738 [Ampulex compressa]|nr:hypothetical protein KM043_002738 [Ampulex compressa]